MVLLSGGIMLAPSTLAAIDTWSPDAAPANDQTDLIAEIADLIIPDTDTPGAKAAKTEQYILLMLRDCTPADQREAFFKGLEAFDQACLSQFGRKFLSVRLDQRQKFLEQEDAKGGAFIRQIKWLTMAANVVDLPEPVGPVTKTKPRGLSASSAKTCGALSCSSVKILAGIVRNTAPEPRFWLNALTRNRAKP